MEKWFEWRGKKKQVYTGLMNKKQRRWRFCAMGQVGGPSITTLKPSGSLARQLHIHEFAVKMAFAELSAQAPVNLKCLVKHF